MLGIPVPWHSISPCFESVVKPIRVSVSVLHAGRGGLHQLKRKRFWPMRATRNRKNLQNYYLKRLTCGLEWIVCSATSIFDGARTVFYPTPRAESSLLYIPKTMFTHLYAFLASETILTAFWKA